jgi:signal transduction histidine kinase
LLRLFLLLTAGAVGARAQTAERIALTEPERAWLAAHPHIRVGYDPEWPPFSLRNELGVFTGIDADVVALIGQRLGVTFEIVASASWTEAYARAERGEIDVLTGTARTPEREQKFHFSSTYIGFPVAIITRKDDAFLWSDYDLVGRRVAGPRNYATIMGLERDYPGVKIRPTATMGEAFDLVARDEADAVVTNLANASFIIKTQGLTDLKIAGIMPQRFELRYAVRQDWPELIGILDKGIASLTRADMQALDHRWIRVDYASVIRWDLVWKTAAAVLAVLGTVIGFLIWHYRAVRAELTQRLALQQELESANTRLNLANAELQVRHEEKNELMRVAAHDLRSPLTAVALGAGLLRENLAGDQRRQAEIMLSSTRQMTRLIDDLLEVHELEEGRRQFLFEAVDVGAALRETLHGLEPVAQHKGIRLEVTGLADLPAVRADAGALREVFDNLCSNALKFSPAGSCLSVSAELRPAFVRVEVRDQGPGVPAGEKERIFTKYARGTAQPTGGEKSTGLGLAIVRELVSVMNGRVWCEDAVGGGAMFVVQVPLAK